MNALLISEKKTELDEGLQQLKHIIKNGWPETKEEVPSEIRGYFNFKEELSIHRVIVPIALRPHMITQVYSSHLGIASCLNKARDVLFWPGMTAEIKDCVSKCETCNTYQTNQLRNSGMSYLWSFVKQHHLTVLNLDLKPIFLRSIFYSL